MGGQYFFVLYKLKPPHIYFGRLIHKNSIFYIVGAYICKKEKYIYSITFFQFDTYVRAHQVDRQLWSLNRSMGRRELSSHAEYTNTKWEKFLLVAEETRCRYILKKKVHYRVDRRLNRIKNMHGWAHEKWPKSWEFQIQEQTQRSSLIAG